MASSEPHQAFIAAHALAPTQSQTKSLCPLRPHRRRPHSRWRCVVQDGSPGEQKPSPAEDPNPVIETDVHSQTEGVVPFDSMDIGFQEALSKKWDTLDIFDEDGSTATKPKTKTPKQPADAVEKPIEATVDHLTQNEDQSQPVADSVKKEKPKAKKKKPKASKSREEEGDTVPQGEKWTSEPRWYFVQVKPGCEQSCAMSIRNMSEAVEEAHILEVLVPTTKIMRLTKGGKAVKKEERFFPGYILVLMAMSRYGYSQILRVPNVQCFMNDPNRDKKKDQPFRPPLPVKDSEMKTVFEKIKEAESGKPEKKTSVRPGDAVEITSGPHQGVKGRISEVKPDLNIVKTDVVIFGRITAVELEFHQVKVIEEEELEAYLMKNAADHEKAKAKPNKKSGRKSSEQPFNEAGIASSADDLMFILNETSKKQTNQESSDTLAYTFDEEDGFESAESIDDQVGEEAPKSVPAQSEPTENNDETMKSKDDQFLADLFLGEETSGGEGLLSSNEDLASFLNGEDDANLWQLDEGEKKAPTMFDDTDDGFEPLSDMKQGASSLIDEAEHPFNAPDDGFTEVAEAKSTKKRNVSIPPPADIGSSSTPFFDEVVDEDVALEAVDEENSNGASDEHILEAELDAKLEAVMNGTDTEVLSKDMTEYEGTGIDFESIPTEHSEGPRKIGCEDLPKFVTSWFEEDELPLVPPEDKARVGGEALLQDVYAELRRCEREGDRKYEFPPADYDLSEPIVEYVEELPQVDLTKPDNSKLEVEEFNYEEVKRKRNSIRAIRKDARRRRREKFRRDSESSAQSK
ncbi:Transcription termination/antitermination protein NusG [Gracilariopsis chorda]|uniref:Transcription termination/antitermination protein NusG n=1 Tax=Gracilariopsis chorda TaxID=448386 RepID=A0A2V3J0K3_9FLOR|nr:Transcription termination/antitermination protein NusG [Gracilariopsis chorda]|eukprot:PXF47942.1 Transcription termination/antitermination protein NusG [Gracilariopsis chorda]